MRHICFAMLQKPLYNIIVALKREHVKYFLLIFSWKQFTEIR